MPEPTALFVTEPSFLDPSRPGGVQRCSLEYVELLEAAGFCVVPHSVSVTASLVPRLKNKVGLGAYELYGRSLADGVLQAVERTGATLVALNQVYLLPAAREMRARGAKVRTVVLSHGNETGDFLHEVVRGGAAGWRRVRAQAQLGKMLYEESAGFMDVDGVLCLSETERQIDQWLGADAVEVVPRTWTPDFLEWTPVQGRIGFVGALNHLPNVEGIGRVLDALSEMNAQGVEVRIVGGGGGADLAERFAGATCLGWLTDEELLEEARTWSLFLNPIWWYARGATTKLAQAIAWGLPLATSTPGKRGYEWGKGELLMTETPEAMAAAAARVAESPEIASALADEVKRVAQSGPSLKEIAQRVRPVLTGESLGPSEQLRWPSPAVTLLSQPA